MSTSESIASHQVVISAENSENWPNLAEIWQYRELLVYLIWRDVKVRYKQTVLGAAWAIIQPAMMMVVFTIFFGRMAEMPTGGLPKPLFFLTGLLPWFFFSTAMGGAANSVLGSERLITKIYFPRLVVPIAAVGAAVVDFLVACSLLAVVLLACGVIPSVTILLAPIVTAIIGLLAIGIGTFLAALNVAYRDFRYVVPFLLQLGMFATPTIYMQPTGEENGLVAVLLNINPMTGLVSGFRASVSNGEIPWFGIMVGLAAALLSLAIGCLYFRRTEDRFADII